MSLPFGSPFFLFRPQHIYAAPPPHTHLSSKTASSLTGECYFFMRWKRSSREAQSPRYSFDLASGITHIQTHDDLGISGFGFCTSCVLGIGLGTLTISQVYTIYQIFVQLAPRIYMAPALIRNGQILKSKDRYIHKPKKKRKANNPPIHHENLGIFDFGCSVVLLLLLLPPL